METTPSDTLRSLKAQRESKRMESLRATRSGDIRTVARLSIEVAALNKDIGELVDKIEGRKPAHNPANYKPFIPTSEN